MISGYIDFTLDVDNPSQAKKKLISVLKKAGFTELGFEIHITGERKKKGETPEKVTEISPEKKEPEIKKSKSVKPKKKLKKEAIKKKKRKPRSDKGTKKLKKE